MDKGEDHGKTDLSEKREKKKQDKGPQNTVQVRLYPTREHACLLMVHSQECISTINVLASAYDAGMIEDGFSTKDFAAALPVPSKIKPYAMRSPYTSARWN